MSDAPPDTYRRKARRAIADPVLQSALAGLQERLGRGAARAYEALPEGPALRLAAHEARRSAIEHLDILLATLARNVRHNGGQVFFAADGREAAAYCLGVARRLGVRRVVKGKSMVSEEIGLNQALGAAGIEVSETDLGEYIIQLAGEHPSHIIAPAIHKTRGQVGRLFAEKLGIRPTDDPSELTRAARTALRAEFLAADMGISGCNLACAETGHITTVSNEGNIRMSATLPRVHVALMGMERVAARLEDHDMLLRLLSRGAAAQNMATYVSYVGGPRQSGQADGPEEFHLVILDNGRSRILADPEFREILCCIRCAACLNVCPVYRKIGGHSYDFPYSGPVGAVVMPLLKGRGVSPDLYFGETLCGACRDACPVDIDLPRMLLALRARAVCGNAAAGARGPKPGEAAAYGLWSWTIRSRRAYDLCLAAAAWLQRIFPRRRGWVRRLPPPFDGWTASRDMPLVAPRPFNRRWRERIYGGGGTVKRG